MGDEQKSNGRHMSRWEQEADAARLRWLGPNVTSIVGWNDMLTPEQNDWLRVVEPLHLALTAAQTAGRDQASEIERMRAKVAELLASQDTCRKVAWHCADETKEVIADATRMAKESLTDLTRERETVRKLLSDNAALETTIDVLAGRLAARGQS